MCIRDRATITIKNIFGKNVFDFPKPVELIKQILTIAGKKDSLVLDFFAGSGTTAQAVLEPVSYTHLISTTSRNK